MASSNVSGLIYSVAAPSLKNRQPPLSFRRRWKHRAGPNRVSHKVVAIARVAALAISSNGVAVASEKFHAADVRNAKSVRTVPANSSSDNDPLHRAHRAVAIRQSDPFLRSYRSLRRRSNLRTPLRVRKNTCLIKAPKAHRVVKALGALGAAAAVVAVRVGGAKVAIANTPPLRKKRTADRLPPNRATIVLRRRYSPPVKTLRPHLVVKTPAVPRPVFGNTAAKTATLRNGNRPTRSPLAIVWLMLLPPPVTMLIRPTPGLPRIQTPDRVATARLPIKKIKGSARIGRQGAGRCVAHLFSP